MCAAFGSKADKTIVINFSANYLTFSFSSLAAIQHEREKSRENKSYRGRQSGRTEEGTPGTGFDPDRAPGRPSKPTSFISIKRIHQELTHKKITMQNKCKLTLNIEEHYTVDIAVRNREVNKVLNIVVISTTFAC